MEQNYVRGTRTHTQRENSMFSMDIKLYNDLPDHIKNATHTYEGNDQKYC